MSRRLVQGLLLFPQPMLTLAHLIAVATLQSPPRVGPVLALAILPAAALVLEPAIPGRRSWLAVGIGVAELAWAAGAGWMIVTMARHAAT